MKRGGSEITTAYITGQRKIPVSSVHIRKFYGFEGLICSTDEIAFAWGVLEHVSNIERIRYDGSPYNDRPLMKIGG